ncbi:integrase/recombinase XerD [Tumebacillus sp. BK434]|uniref:tyrosine-type recombinase/integrase n=1 Tax=Tumebacillus sp. BK434 TaxID=2512169 RepID=UPI00104DAF1F|nr:tyrosine-type recombinase/integrase [Tumebacillus sp. BK434]TCP55506.1 integrase/recombinase XerD [Tumebacillus sp. BK434]
MSKKRVTLRKGATQEVTGITQKKFSLQQLFDLFIASKKAEGSSSRTIQDYHDHYRYFILWLETTERDHMTPYELDVNIFRIYIAYMSDKYSPVTVNTRLTTIKTMFNFLFEEGLLPTNPLQRIRKVREPEDTIGAFSEEQVTSLLAQPDQRTFYGFRDYVMMTLMLDTGIRINEVLSLEVKNMDFAQRQITIEGGKSKNKRARVIPITKHTAKLLHELVCETKQHFSIDLVFVSSDGNPMSYFTAYSNISKYGAKAGIDDARVSPHTFRHTFAKMYILSGGDAFSLQRILGHSTLHMVRKYIQLNTEDLRMKHAQHSPILSLMSKRARAKR